MAAFKFWGLTSTALLCGWFVTPRTGYYGIQLTLFKLLYSDAHISN